MSLALSTPKALLILVMAYIGIPILSKSGAHPSLAVAFAIASLMTSMRFPLIPLIRYNSLGLFLRTSIVLSPNSDRIAKAVFSDTPLTFSTRNRLTSMISSKSTSSLTKSALNCHWLYLFLTGVPITRIRLFLRGRPYPVTSIVSPWCNCFPSGSVTDD